MLSPRFQYAPQELVEYILQRTVQACIDPSSSRERAELAALALISQTTRNLVIPVLYRTVELHNDTSAKLFLWTVTARGELWTARHVHALYIAPDGISKKIASSLALKCGGLFFQCPLDVFQGLIPARGPAAVSVAQDRRFSFSYGPRLSFVDPTFLCRTFLSSQVSYFHLGFHDVVHGLEPTYMTLVNSLLTLINEIDSASQVTHVALDWHHDAMQSAQELRTLLAAVGTDEHHPRRRIRRLVIRVPIWQARDSQEHSQDIVCDILEHGVRESRVEFVAIHRVVLDVGSAQEAHQIMAYESWRRHACGSEDLWLTGTPVLPD
ncbi:hypothetical protein BKA62DRAFT_834092 [Auriculariales sp. MPI-PUGE-AT-0066]|nr:hypothetical protein BKA62DRAFT_834092 [Auriculariales sp. MPI-PUGE-AT-0066]